MVPLAIVTTNHRKSADVIVAKKSGKPDGAKDRTVNQLEYVLIESLDKTHAERSTTSTKWSELTKRKGNSAWKNKVQ